MFYHAFAASSAVPEKLERGGTTSPLKIARQCQNVNPVASGVNAVEDVHATQQWLRLNKTHAWAFEDGMSELMDKLVHVIASHS